VAGRVDDLEAGVARATEAIDSGAAKDVLRGLIAITNEAAPGD
jgi:anthranilate phosphoribosyltransferase